MTRPRRQPKALPDLGGMFLLIVVTMIAFQPALEAQFTSWDDYETVARNPLMLPPTTRSLATFWTRPLGHLYIPITYTAWAAVARLRFEATTFHCVNVGFHIAAAFMVYGVIDLLVRHRGAAIIAALLFALHSVQVESVAWVSGLKDVLSGWLSLCAIYGYLKFAEDERPQFRRIHYVVATAFFVLAMLSKPTAMVVPLVVITLDLTILRRPMRDVFRATWPWLLLAIPCAVMAKLFQPSQHLGDVAPLWSRPLVALDAMAFYLGKLVWPATLTIDYGRTPAHVIATRQIAWTWLIPVAGVTLAVWSWRRGVREVAAGLLVVVVVLLPVLGLVPFDFQTYSTVADHYLYLAMLGPALIVATLPARRPTRAAFVLAAGVLLVLRARTFAQARHWHDSASLFTHALDANPRSWVAYNSLAALALEKDDPDRAKTLAEKSIDIRPTALAFTTLAEANRRAGDTVAAGAAYEEALARDAAFAPALANFAVMLAQRGKLDEAIPLARRAVDAAPDDAAYRVNLALMYLDANRADLARPQLEAALELDPNNEAVREQLRQMR